MSGLSPHSERSSVQNNHVFDREADKAPACRIAVGGMMCQESCGSTVKAAIQSVKGVRKVTVSFSDKEARVWGDAAVSLVIDAIESVGFDAALILDGPVALLDQKRPELVLAVQQAKKETRNGNHFSKTETAKAVPSSSNRSPFLTVIELEIIGMSSSGCVRSIESGLKACMGIQSVRVALIAEEAEIVFDSSIITPGQILDKILIMGYSATVLKRRKLGDGSVRKELVFSVTGMSCANCASKIEKILIDRPGVLEVGVSSITNKARVIVDGDLKSAIGPRDVTDLVEALGFECHLIGGAGIRGSTGHGGLDDLMIWSRLLLAAVLLGVPVMILHISSMSLAYVKMTMMKPAMCSGGVTLGQVVMVILNVPLQFGVGYRYYRSAFLGALHGSFGMDCLVVTGTTVTFVYSCVQLTLACRTGEPTKHVFFEVSGMLLMFVTFGKYLEAYAKGKTVSAITNLLSMQPSHALLVVNSESIRYFNSNVVSAGVSAEVSSSGASSGVVGSSSSVVGSSSSVVGSSSSGGVCTVSVEGSRHPPITLSSPPFTPTPFTPTIPPLRGYGAISSPAPAPAPAAAANTVTDRDRASKGRDIKAGTQYEYAASNSTEILKEIPVDLVQKDDILKVLPGARIPTDGYILTGSAFIDESMITGESLPTLHIQGDAVFGSTVNQQSTIYIKATAVGSEGALAQIVRMVETAQMNKAPVQAYADRIAGMFTPMVLCVAVLTFLTWAMLAWMHRIPREWFSDEYGDPLLFAMLFAISVVVISCPCALGLATPTAIMVGTSVGAFNGILIKGGEAFETAHKVNTVIFDKTGTLTVGKPCVTDVVLCDRLLDLGMSSTSSDDSVKEDSSNRMIRLAATAEQGSEHPLASAVLTASRVRRMTLEQLPPTAFESTTGCGVRCVTSEGVVLVGNRDFLALHSVPLGSLADSSMWNIEVQGKTAVCVALENEILGILGIADVPKPEAYLAVTALRSAGVDVWMVTGDNKTTAEAIADEFGIPKDRVVSGAMPQDKVAKVRELQRAGRSVAMVGDGVNDSPALASANLGIAIGAGTHVAIEAADMVLVRSNLLDVVVALDLAKVVFRRIRINFMFALVYNILAIPFAAGVWFPYTHMQVPPQYAGLSMAMSSISVVASSMAIRFYKKPQILSSGVTGAGSGGGAGAGVTDRELREEVGVMGIAKNSGIFSHTKSRLDTLAETWLPIWKGAIRSDRISYQALTTMDVCDSKEERHKSLRRDWALHPV